MNAQIIFLLGVVFCSSAFLIPWRASAQQRDLKPGLNYTAVYNKPLKRAAPPEGGEPAASPEEETAPGTISKESAESRIWNKYKALAAGTAGQLPETPEKPAPPEPASSPESKSGKVAMNGPSITIEGPKSTVAELIGRWQERKEQQKDMRSKSFQVPARLEHFKQKDQPKTR